jgi:hypothetical protein
LKISGSSAVGKLGVTDVGEAEEPMAQYAGQNAEMRERCWISHPRYRKI